MYALLFNHGGFMPDSLKPRWHNYDSAYQKGLVEDDQGVVVHVHGTSRPTSP